MSPNDEAGIGQVRLDIEPIRLTAMGKIETRLDELGLTLPAPIVVNRPQAHLSHLSNLTH